jgi:S-adenosylmethionine synthetase
MKEDFIFTSESVTEGHPDKLCDQISDAVLDQFLRDDPYARAIVECAVSTGIVFIAARYRSSAIVDIPQVARQVIAQVGYDQPDFNARTSSIMTSINELPDGAPMRDEHELADAEIEAITAQNPATVFGFACTHTSAYMPLPIFLAHKLARRVATARLTHRLPYLRPDAKVQVAVEFAKRRPARIHSVTLLASHTPQQVPAPDQLKADLVEHVVLPAFYDESIKPDRATAVFVNPEGPIPNGGPALHAGLTGRKNAIDTYGEYARHSGAALSGKGPRRIDRVGAYAARYAAKNVVAAGLADECEVTLSYTIGRARPVSVQVETFGTGRVSDQDIAERIEKYFDFRPAGIVRAFDLRRLSATTKGGFFRKLATFGHVGRMDMGLPWERADKVSVLTQPALTKKEG